MRVRHIMSVNPVACDVADSCAKVARYMRDRGVGFVCCLEDGRVAGIVTDRDLVLACLAEGRDGESLEVRQVMTASPALVDPDETIFAVLDTMRSAGMVRRVPVVDRSGALCGVVSLSDMAGVAKDILDGILAEELHHATREARVLTGAKRIAKRIRRPTKMGRMPEAPIARRRGPSREGVVRNPVPGRRKGGRQLQRPSRGQGRTRASRKATA